MDPGPEGDRLELLKASALTRPFKKGEWGSYLLLCAELLKKSGGVLRDLMVKRWNSQQPQGSNPRYVYDIPLADLKGQLQPALNGLVKVYQLHQGDFMAAAKVHFQAEGSRVVAALLVGPQLVTAKQGRVMQEKVLEYLNDIPADGDNARAGSMVCCASAKHVQAAYGQLLKAPRSALHMRQRSGVYRVYLSSPCQEVGELLHFLGVVAGCLGALVAPDGLPGVLITEADKPHLDAAYKAASAARREVELAKKQQLVGLGYLLDQWQPPDKEEAAALRRLLKGLQDHEPISLGVERTAAAEAVQKASDLQFPPNLDSQFT
jgi:hypothetical protein